MESYNFVTASDARLKTDFSPIPVDCLDLVRRVEPQQFRYRSDKTGQLRWGLRAQDVEAAGGPVTTAANGMKSLSLNDQLAVLWGAVRKLANSEAAFGAALEHE